MTAYILVESLFLKNSISFKSIRRKMNLQAAQLRLCIVRLFFHKTGYSCFHLFESEGYSLPFSFLALEYALKSSSISSSYNKKKDQTPWQWY